MRQPAPERRRSDDRAGGRDDRDDREEERDHPRALRLHATTRRNPPRDVGRDAIVAVSRFPSPFGSRPTVGRRHRSRVNAPPTDAGAARHRSIHHPSTGRPLTSAAPLRSWRVEREIRAAVRRERQRAADELRGRDDVAVGDPPADRASRVQRERLDLALDEQVRQPRRAEQRHERRAAAVRPAQLPGAARERVGDEAVADHEERRSCPRAGRRAHRRWARRSARSSRPAGPRRAARRGTAGRGRPTRGGRGR